MLTVLFSLLYAWRSLLFVSLLFVWSSRVDARTSAGGTLQESCKPVLAPA